MAEWALCRLKLLCARGTGGGRGMTRLLKVRETRANRPEECREGVPGVLDSCFCSSCGEAGAPLPGVRDGQGLAGASPGNTRERLRKLPGRNQVC